MLYYVFMTAHPGIACLPEISCSLNNFHARLSLHVLKRSVESRMLYLDFVISGDQRGLAPRGGFEPPTFLLTAECSTVELPGNWTAISNHFNTFRCGLLHGNHARFGPIGPNFETQTDFLS